MILHSKPWITESDIEFVAATLRGGMIAQDKLSAQFVVELSQSVGALGGVAVGSAAAAIVLALRALDIGEADEVILPTYVCPSVLNAVITAGAVPVLCDVDKDWLVTPRTIRPVSTSKSRAVIVPHMYGIFADIGAIKSLGLAVIEDCAQALGDKKQHEIAGDISVFSFHPTKCLTTGEGGVAVTSDQRLLCQMKTLKEEGTTPGERFFSPMSDLNAALGLAQLRRYPEFLSRRMEIAQEYIELFQNLCPERLPINTFKNTMFFRFPIRISDDFNVVMRAFEKMGVHVRRGVDRLLHRMSELPDSNFRNAVKLYNSTLSIPIYPAMTKEEIEACALAIRQIFSDKIMSGE